ncbi:MAG: AlpA family phage regulatory protein [Rhodoferax sp.]|uniref:helix-turn-helix transcriptional regulator n=1 Tax=Rhodoferax sp. TaxID=50421 RepID=UPI00301A77D6
MTNSVQAIAATSANQLYRERDITSRGKFSKAHLYKMVSKNEFPRQVITAPRFARWGSEVDVWFADPVAWIEAHKKSDLKGGAA